MTDTEVTDTAATDEKAELSPEQKAQRHAVRVLARALSKFEGKATAEERKARWNEGKVKYTNEARKLVKSLVREGIVFQINEAATLKAKRAGKKADRADGADAAESGD